MIDERTRHEMYLGLEEKLGTNVADAVMQHLPPVGWADVATKHDLAGLEERMQLRFQLVDQRFEIVDARFDAVDARFDAVDARFDAVDRRFEMVDAQFDAVDRRFDSLFDVLDARFAAVDHQLDAKIEASQRTLIQWMVGTMIALTTVLTAVGALTRLA